jgi:hypothetical protein
MPTAGELSYVLKGLGFQDNQVAHIMNSYDDIEQIKDLFLEFNNDKPGLKDELKKLVNNKNFSDSDIHRLILLMDWYDHQQVRKPDFDWKQFNGSDFIGFKRQTKVNKTCHSLLTHFNGVDMIQAHTHITISVEKSGSFGL